MARCETDPEVGARPGEGVVVVAPLVEALLLRAVRRRPAGTRAPAHRPTRLVGRPHPVESVALRRRPDLRRWCERPGSGDLEVLPAGSLVLPALLGLRAPTYVVVTHEPVEVWLRVGPFETLDDRVVQQVELRLTVALGDSASGLRDLADEPGSARARPGSRGSATRSWTGWPARSRRGPPRPSAAARWHELVDSSLGVLLDGALPPTFLGGLLERSALEVVDVDWPTEGRGWVVPAPPAAVSR